jgi:hypothetical protein
MAKERSPACFILGDILSIASGRKGPEVGSIQRTKSEVADYIEQFLNGTGGKWDWDDFTSGFEIMRGLVATLRASK